ncbi:putative bifunctional diguanylate cyclase/phosphodiesterase [Undibacterium fentianense]|uniref:EAL domain-containing protein n=1 Tax=Undibacterium fentianense TaxID=2828728 RepID=A0A941E621_9BURK|nr:EAL domain-containing protein [Undibacterium fentianense]MBR7799403.1 EAL domain-containing protein [Undibacterium fentianense]
MKNVYQSLIDRCLPSRISYRLALSYLAILSLFIFVTVRSVVHVQEVSKRSQEFANQDLQKLLQVQNLALDIEGSTSALVLIFNATQEKRKPAYDAIDAKKKHIDELIQQLSTEFEDEAQRLCLEKLSITHQQYRQSYLNLFDEIELEHALGAKQVFETQVAPAREQFLNESNTLLVLAKQRIQLRQEEVRSDLARLKLEILAISILAVLLGIGLAFMTQHSVVQPLRMLELNALRIASGDYSHKLPPTNTAEISQVSQALNIMTDAVAVREAEIKQLAYFDQLSGLPNRTHLLKKYEHQDLQHHAMIIMDMARLKIVNETLGFGTGDTLIVETCRRIQHAVNPYVDARIFLAKFSGGQFALICAEKSDSDSKGLVQRLIEGINHALNLPIQCNSYSVDINLVFGVALANAETKNLTTLIRNAEIALYAAKERTASSAWYSDAQEASRLSHLSLLSDLRAAIQNDELQMWLQPKIRLCDQSCYGFEALVRWQHPRRGFISPAEFVPFAERAGYIHHVTNWMLEKAVKTLAQWRDRYPTLSIAVNVSTNDLRDHHFPDRVRQFLHQYQVTPNNLHLELTESGIMENPENAITLLDMLRNTGIGLSIDDFGTGHSSLAYLQKLPVSELKIDRSFVINLDQHDATQKLVKTIIDMGHGLDLHVIAEGIETQEERTTLTDLGCDAIQGYFASKPLHGSALDTWLENLPRSVHRG